MFAVIGAVVALVGWLGQLLKRRAKPPAITVRQAASTSAPTESPTAVPATDATASPPGPAPASSTKTGATPPPAQGTRNQSTQKDGGKEKTRRSEVAPIGDPDRDEQGRSEEGLDEEKGREGQAGGQASYRYQGHRGRHGQAGHQAG
jgi:hypothetical protein